MGGIVQHVSKGATMNLATILVLVGTIFGGVALFTDIRFAAVGVVLVGVGVLAGATP